jgi:hypothetical protein
LMVMIVPPKLFKFILGETIVTARSIEIEVADGSTGISPKVSVTTGSHVPATASTLQVISVEVY